MNLSSNYTDFLVVSQPTALNVVDVYRDVCSGLDGMVIICIFLILTFYTLSRIIVPLAKRGLEDSVPVAYAFFGTMLTYVEDFFETMSLMSIMFIVTLLWMGGKLEGRFKLWFAVLTLLVALAALPKLIGWMRGGMKSGSIEMVKKIVDKAKETEL